MQREREGEGGREGERVREEGRKGGRGREREEKVGRKARWKKVERRCILSVGIKISTTSHASGCNESGSVTIDM